MNFIKSITDKIGSRKLAVGGGAVALAMTGEVALTWPMAVVCGCYVLGQAIVDAAKARNGENS
tara:strand:+ start:416 stop:604 length:189 start_codon:yes stop_codon:yes gene_type:complete